MTQASKKQSNAAMAAENTAAVTQAVLAAGPSGATVTELCDVTTLCSKSVCNYLRRLPQVLRVGRGGNHCVRWFHVDHADGAKAYQKSLEASYLGPTKRRWSLDKQIAATRMIVESGSVGMTVADVAAVLQMRRATVNSLLAALMGEKAVQRRNEGFGVKRYFGPSVDVQPLKRARRSTAKPKHLHKRPGPKPGTARTVLKPSAKKPAPAPVVREVIVPANVKITVCPGFTGNRFAPTNAPRLFSSLAPGSYLRTGSAIERAYGQGDV